MPFKEDPPLLCPSSGCSCFDVLDEPLMFTDDDITPPACWLPCGGIHMSRGGPPHPPPGAVTPSWTCDGGLCHEVEVSITTSPQNLIQLSVCLSRGSPGSVCLTCPHMNASLAPASTVGSFFLRHLIRRYQIGGFLGKKYTTSCERGWGQTTKRKNLEKKCLDSFHIHWVLVFSGIFQVGWIFCFFPNAERWPHSSVRSKEPWIFHVFLYTFFPFINSLYRRQFSAILSWIWLNYLFCFFVDFPAVVWWKPFNSRLCLLFPNLLDNH